MAYGKKSVWQYFGIKTSDNSKACCRYCDSVLSCSKYVKYVSTIYMAIANLLNYETKSLLCLCLILCAKTVLFSFETFKFVFQ
jgi:BED zinc finger